MTNDENPIRVGVVQAAPVFLDRDASTEKAVQIISKAARHGVQLLVFGESWLPGYPMHAWTNFESPMWWSIAERYFDQAIDLSDPAIETLCIATSEAGFDVVIGIAERDSQTQGTLYSTLMFIGNDGQIISKQRKLKPFAFERVIWADGKETDLQVYDRPYGRLSGLLSTEHQMALPSFALAEQGCQIHAACWPGHPLNATSPISAMWPDRHVLSRAFAIQAGAYVLCADTLLDPASLPAKYRPLASLALGGGSSIIDPRGAFIVGPKEGEELLLADCLPASIRAAKIGFDCAGHSARPDQLNLLSHMNSGMPEPDWNTDAETDDDNQIDRELDRP